MSYWYRVFEVSIIFQNKNLLKKSLSRLYTISIFRISTCKIFYVSGVFESPTTYKYGHIFLNKVLLMLLPLMMVYFKSK